jgi:D-glycero-alpha-D-manno-heptose-7-phosphate kinase
VQIEATAPCRADLAGGTLDIWPIGLLHPGAVTVNVALPVRVRLLVDAGAPAGEVWQACGDAAWSRLGVGDIGTDLTAAVCLALRPRGGLRVRCLEQAPFGSGLGGSSTYGVALAQAVLALDGRELAEPQLVALIRDLEARLLGTATGTQDHWAAVRGGLVVLRLEPGGEQLEEPVVDAAWLAERMTVFFTGITHHSGMVNWQALRRRLDHEPVTTTAFAEIAAAARDCHRALLTGDDASCAAAIRREWAARRRLAPEVAPAEIEHLETVASAAGAAAFKACGAGGGGSVLLWHAPDARPGLVAALQAAAPAGRAMPPGIAPEGCTVRAVEGGPSDIASSTSCSS